MTTLDGRYAVVTRFVRKLRGGSQPILVEASDGFKYVLKFINNPQGPNVLFNEAMGTELYRAAGLPVPIWRPLNITKTFLRSTPESWMSSDVGEPLWPWPSLCFGTRYVEQDENKVWEILPGSSLTRIVNKKDFYLAWLLDICARHTDNRQALFQKHVDGYHAIFVDHGHMFSGPLGGFCKPHYRKPTYLDLRVYEHNLNDHGREIAKMALNLDTGKLWRCAGRLPNQWCTDSALQNFAACLCVLSETNTVKTIAELIADFPSERGQHEFRANEQQLRAPDWLLRAGVQRA